VESCPPKCLVFAAVEAHTAFIPRTYRQKTAPDGASVLLLPGPGRNYRLIAWRHHESGCGSNRRRSCVSSVRQRRHREGAILAGCRVLLRYPITPASEIAEAAALYIRQVGGTFLQAEAK